MVLDGTRAILHNSGDFHGTVKNDIKDMKAAWPMKLAGVDSGM